MNLNSTVQPSAVQLSCNVCGEETAILNIDTGVCYGLTGVGARIWNLIQQPKTLAEICATIAGQYDVDAIQCETEIRGLLADLATANLIEIRAETSL